VAAAIVIERLSKVWPDGTVALRDVSLKVDAGEVIAILGGSGAGKSTLLRCASRLVEPTDGRIEIAGRDLRAQRGRALAHARASIGFVFQQFNLVRSYTAFQNVLLARIAHVSWTRGLLGWFSPADRELALKMLDDVGMREKSHALARELSGGQQQRVAIARAFAQEPKALFADEPTASLDPKLADTVLELLRGYGNRASVPVLINVHTIEHARKYADRVIGLRRGALVFDGPIATLDDAALEAIYGRAEDDA
jgi:phosphonate transport system ATP-binding protein